MSVKQLQIRWHRKYPASEEAGYRAVPFLLLQGLILCALVSPVFGQGSPETVGRIEGDDLAIKGQVSLLREGGHSAAELVSGAEVTVRTGLARITLADGGEVDICGPAQFTVLKSGGSLTLALNQGRVHVRIGPESSGPVVTIYTAQVVASLISVGERPRDATIGVEADGSLRVVAAHGAVRLEHQLTGQSLVVPQSSEVVLPGGQLESLREARGECRCEPVFARAAPPAPTPVQLGALASNEGDAAKTDAAKKDPTKPASEEPKWTVVMPPLTFDATKPPPALEPRAETILLVREVRVQPAVVFTGRVEKPPKVKTAKKQQAAVAPVATVATPTEGVQTESATGEKKSGSGFGSKLRNFFRRMFGGKPKN
jgi:hypothetical protein